MNCIMGTFLTCFLGMIWQSELFAQALFVDPLELLIVTVCFFVLIFQMHNMKKTP